MRASDWQIAVDLYTRIKELYIECEETDPELNTNLQPLNEFRAALDHVFRLIRIELETEKGDSFNLPEFNVEYEKLRSHLCRAYFDICDMLSMNYRNKIVDTLEPYTKECILAAMPDYYRSLRPEIGLISERIAKYRSQKGSVPVNELVDLYYNDVISLRNTYKTILTSAPALDDYALRESRGSRNDRYNRWGVVIGGIVGAIGVVVGILGFIF